MRFPIRLPKQPRRYIVSFARYSDLLVENRANFIPHLYLAPPQGVTPSEFREDLSTQKTRMNGLSCGEEIMTRRSAVLIGCQRVTDGQTDVQTISITCFSIADARKNLEEFWDSEKAVQTCMHGPTCICCSLILLKNDCQQIHSVQ